MGEPTEAALRVLAEKLPCPDGELSKTLSSLSPAVRATAVNEFYERTIPRLMTFEFSRDRKMMSVLVRRNGSGALFVKGAPESVLDRCTNVLVGNQVVALSAELRTALLQQTLSYGSQGLRTLAMAYVEETDIDPSHYEQVRATASLHNALERPHLLAFDRRRKSYPAVSNREEEDLPDTQLLSA